MPAALAKLERFSGVAIEGHPDVTFDGVFKLVELNIGPSFFRVPNHHSLIHSRDG